MSKPGPKNPISSKAKYTRVQNESKLTGKGAEEDEGVVLSGKWNFTLEKKMSEMEEAP